MLRTSRTSAPRCGSPHSGPTGPCTRTSPKHHAKYYALDHLLTIYLQNPLAYAFDSLMSTEFYGQLLPCVGNNLVPNGPGYTDPNHQSCAGVPGATQGQTSFMGDQYLSALSYSHSHIWRNFGIVWAWWVLFIALTVIFTSRWRSAAEGGASLLIPRENAKVTAALKNDEEAQTTEDASGNKSDNEKRDANGNTSGDETDQNLVRNTSIFTWKNLTYTVKTPSGDRKLLDNVQGYVKPVSLHRVQCLITIC